MNTFPLTISTPDGHVFSEEAVMLAVRGTEGELAILANHAPFVTTVVPCDCKIELPDDTDRTGHVEGGLLTVSAKGVTLLSGSFHWNE